MSARTIGIILNGATSRICSTQHMENALVPIRDEGGLEIAGERVVPRFLLVGRDAARLEALGRRFAIADWSTDLDAALADPDFPVFFEASATHLRPAALARAISAGKHIYSEKPVAPTTAEGLQLLRMAEARGVRHGAVEDKHYLPGPQKLAALVREGFFGEIRHFQIEFGWWVFDGRDQPCQRPSWNYQKSGGGGLILDMNPHWRYVIETIFGRITSLVASAWTATPERLDEAGTAYAVDVEDSTSAQVELEGGVRGTIFASWARRVRDDEALTIHVDGTAGSAVAGAHRCHVQPGPATPLLKWSPNEDLRIDTRADWSEVTGKVDARRPYRVGWEGFLRHVVAGEPFAADLSAGIRDVQFAQACHRSIAERRWIDMDDIETV